MLVLAPVTSLTWPIRAQTVARGSLAEGQRLTQLTQRSPNAHPTLTRRAREQESQAQSSHATMFHTFSTHGWRRRGVARHRSLSGGERVLAEHLLNGQHHVVREEDTCMSPAQRPAPCRPRLASPPCHIDCRPGPARNRCCRGSCIASRCNPAARAARTLQSAPAYAGMQSMQASDRYAHDASK